MESITLTVNQHIVVVSRAAFTAAGSRSSTCAAVAAVDIDLGVVFAGMDVDFGFSFANSLALSKTRARGRGRRGWSRCVIVACGSVVLATTMYRRKLSKYLPWSMCL